MERDRESTGCQNFPSWFTQKIGSKERKKKPVRSSKTTIEWKGVYYMDFCGQLNTGLKFGHEN